MSYVAAVFLLHMDDEYSAFVAFANMSTRYPVMPFYAFDHVLV
jgi:hypothetical protein